MYIWREQNLKADEDEMPRDSSTHANTTSMRIKIPRNWLLVIMKTSELSLLELLLQPLFS